MIESVDAPHSLKSNDLSPNKKALKQTARHLRLIVSNPDPLSHAMANSIQNQASHAPFTVETRATEPGHYIMEVLDASNFVGCKLPLEIRLANEGEDPSKVICQFPCIDFRKLSEFIWDDEILYGILAIRFQMKVMEQLMLFCAEHIVDTLVVVMNSRQAEEFEIYQNCVVAQKNIFTRYGKKTQMTIAASIEQYDTWVEFMEETKLRFGQTLWSEQRSNPAIENYLKTHDLAGI